MKHRRAMAARLRAMAEGASTPGRVPTPDGWVTLDGGGVVPASSARPTGWGDDRDAVNAARITAARADMAEAVQAYRRVTLALFNPIGDKVTHVMDAVRAADAMAKAWDTYTEATS